MKKIRFKSKKKPLVAELAWLAGIIDGEGTLGLYKITRGPDYYKNKKYHNPTWRVDLRIETCSEKMITKAAKIFSGIVGRDFTMYIYERDYSKFSYYLITSCSALKNTKRILEAIYPYLVTKKDRAEILIDYIKHRENIPRGRGEKNLIAPIYKEKLSRVE